MSKNQAMRDELKKLSADELIGKIHTLRRELFSLRLHAVTSPGKDKMLAKRMRRDIARALTCLNQLTKHNEV